MIIYFVWIVNFMAAEYQENSLTGLPLQQNIGLIIIFFENRL